MVFCRWALAVVVVFSHALARELRWSPLDAPLRNLQIPLEKLQEKPWLRKTVANYQAVEVTPQPPTRDQDTGRCAWAALPNVINLAPKDTSFFTRSGRWVNKQDAELGSWVQNRFRMDYTNLDYFVDQKPWFTAQVLKNPAKELENMLIELPAPNSIRFGLEDPRNWHTVVYKDCENTPMYVSREIGLNTGNFEIFNQLGQLVATGGRSGLVSNQFYFRDPDGAAFAIAGSPSIAEGLGSLAEEIDWKPDHMSFDFDHWQVWFVPSFGSSTYLKEPDNRWVIAAVIQEHAILTILEKDPSAALPYFIFLISSVVAVCAGLGICCFACSQIFFLVYPSKKPSTENPFMTMDIGGHPYGSFALARQKRVM
jgi:hypothetical protein|mmetsp:Transcript_96763/g.153155  ORF Transcript_96763/g.153155 Transcript_96763/m.153155 type:complete len:368 (+) Transcript_96763:98-1201(+)